MPSPFPGMDPYLEDPDVWPDFHDHFAAEIAAVLNASLPTPYYARLGKRAELGIVEEDARIRRMIPDVAVLDSKQTVETENVAGAELPRTEVSKSVEVQIELDPVEHHFVEIRDARRGHAVVTVIEIASPSNKLPGDDRKSYLAKQREVLASDANLIEIDLLRSRERLLPAMGIMNIVDRMEPAPDYLVLVHRAWKRNGASSSCQIFPIVLEDRLPCISVPLHEDVAEAPLDLQYTFDRAYDRGPYLRGAVDYAQQPNPPLEGERTEWAAKCLREFQTRHSPH